MTGKRITLRTMLLVVVVLLSVTGVAIATVAGQSYGQPRHDPTSNADRAVGVAARRVAVASAWGSFLGTPKVLTASDNLPADCIPNPSGPPGAPYELGLVGTVNNGVLVAGPARVADINAKF